METHLKIVGCLLVVLAFIHFIFPRRFNWKEDLREVSLINKQLMYVHMFFIALAVLLMGVLCLYCSVDMVHTKLGKSLCFGLFIFWVVRLIFQFFVYSPQLWTGKKFETVVHVLFSLLWVYFSVVFLIIAIG